MAKWTKSKNINDKWSVEECIDELYDFHEKKIIELNELNDKNFELDKTQQKMITRMSILISVNCATTLLLFYYYLKSYFLV